ncbi:MAG: PhoH family protein [Eubacterium sp.]|jgi:phosphate starvation-inducible PhoH-like protein|nr:PhoH family protein [Eubacterium sp.]
MTERIIEFKSIENIGAVFGQLDSNLNIICKSLSVSVIARDTAIKISGNELQVEQAAAVLKGLETIAENNKSVTPEETRYIIAEIVGGDRGGLESVEGLSSDCIYVSFSGKPIKPKTIGQKKYVDSIKKTTITFGVGPAGTGKTYLAVALAVRAFKAKEIQRIILTRPAVEAGEKLGFLPGDLQNKVDPYLRPLYDALFDMMGSESFQKNIDRGVIEVAPLAYMRGRTLDDSFIILDEAQNSTPEQMKMFLTRLGFGSKMVITGDITQIDLVDKRSGLVEAISVLKNIEDIEICRFTERDVVRHKLVQDIVKAYEKRKNQIEGKAFVKKRN